MAEEYKNPQGIGTFCWVELGTSNPEVAKGFYAKLFGWEAQDLPMGPMTYTMLKLKGKEVAGLYGLMPEQLKMHVPPHWLSYVQVENVDAMQKKAEKLGAKTMMPPMDVGDMGRSVVLQDPTGAVFALWQVVKGGGNALLDAVHGNRCWCEVLTNNVDRAGKFYSELFGWKIQSQQFGPTAYHMFQNGKDTVGGMMAINKEWGEVPSNWMVYFNTDDCDKTVSLVQAAGGKPMMPAFDMEGIGRVAVVMDPQGASFGFVQPPK